MYYIGSLNYNVKSRYLSFIRLCSLEFRSVAHYGKRTSHVDLLINMWGMIFDPDWQQISMVAYTVLVLRENDCSYPRHSLTCQHTFIYARVTM